MHGLALLRPWNAALSPPAQGLSPGGWVVSDTGISLTPFPSFALPALGDIRPSRSVGGLGLLLLRDLGGSLVTYQPSCAGGASYSPPGVTLGPLTTVDQVTIPEYRGEIEAHSADGARPSSQARPGWGPRHPSL